MSHRIFGRQKLFFIYVKLFPYMISDGESQMPLLQFLLRGGGSVYRLDSDKSQYFAITEHNCFIILILLNVYILGKQSDLSFSRKEKSMVSFTYEQNIICSQTPEPNTRAKRSWTTLRMSKPLFVWWALDQ